MRSLARWKKRVRRAAIERDGYRCRACGKAAGRFEVDHIIPAGGWWRCPTTWRTFKRFAGLPVTFDKTTIDRGGVPHVPDAGWERLVGELL